MVVDILFNQRPLLKALKGPTEMATTPSRVVCSRLTLCVLVSVASAAIVTIAFYSYREALTTNRLAAELSAQAFATAPVVASRWPIAIRPAPRRCCAALADCIM